MRPGPAWIAAAAASGLADVDAVTLATSRQSHEGFLAPEAAGLAITIAVIANTVMKGGIAVGLGRRAFGGPIAGVFAFAIAIGLAAAAAQGSRGW